MANSKLLEAAEKWKNDEISSKSTNLESVSEPKIVEPIPEPDLKDSPEILELSLKLKRWNCYLEMMARSGKYMDELWGNRLPKEYTPKK